MALIDHLVYAVPDLEAGIDDLEDRIGIRAAYGGAHPGMGTRNALISFGDAYLEIIAPDPDQPEPAGARPFGVTSTMEPTLATFAARPDPTSSETIESLVEAMRSVGHDAGQIVAMSRETPDGSTLSWRLTFPTMTHDGIVPFLIDWGDTPNPSTSAPGGLTLDRLSAGASAESDARSILSALALNLPFDSERARMRATITGPTGTTQL